MKEVKEEKNRLTTRMRTIARTMPTETTNSLRLRATQLYWTMKRKRRKKRKRKVDLTTMSTLIRI